MLEKISKDMISAMKSGDKEYLATLRMVKAQIDLEKINKKKELNDDDVISIIAKQIKMREDSIKEFEKASRQDLIDKTAKEIEYLKPYLPKQLSMEEIETIIDEAFSVISPTSSADMGKLMKEVMPKLKGKADMSIVNQIIKTKLSNL